MYFWIFLGALATAVVLILLISYICFYLAFYVPHRKDTNSEEYPLPPGEIYKPHRDTMVKWMKEVRGIAHEEFYITSFDGLKLHGKYYEYSPDAPIELMLHGYRGNAERDLCGGVQRCFSLKRNVLLVDQRASGKSKGNVITFGVNESRDCLSWVNFIIEHFGKDAKIILTGISMGAATVLIAAGMPLPDNVVGILADCGYTSARDIIKKVIRDMKLPANLLYPFVKLGARLYGGFKLEETSPIETVKKCKVPIIFIHGESDKFVPCEMSRQNYDACSSQKRLLTVPDAGHGLCYLIDRDGYINALTEFSSEFGL